MASIGIFQDVFRGGDHAAEGKVSNGEVYGHGQFTGTLDPGVGGDMPSENDVRSGVQYDNATKTGNVHVPALEMQVVDGVAFDTAKIGNQVLVTTGDNVRRGVMFGPDGLTAGTIDLPSAPTVLDGTGYGANSTELTGTRTDCPDDESIGTASYGDPGSPTTGRWSVTNVIPSNMRVDQTFGVDGGQSGTLDPGAGVTPRYPTEGETASGVVFGDEPAPQFIGSRVDCPDVSALASVTPYGDPGSPIAGRYHEENLIETNVRIAIAYGVDLGQTGTLDPQGTVTPSPPGWSTLYGVAYDEAGQPEEGVAIKAKMIAAAEGTESIFDSAIRATITAADGSWQFANCPQGSTYQVIRGATTETVIIDAEILTPIDAFVAGDEATMAAGGLW